MADVLSDLALRFLNDVIFLRIGGHGGAADAKQSAFMTSLGTFKFFQQT